MRKRKWLNSSLVFLLVFSMMLTSFGSSAMGSSYITDSSIKTMSGDLEMDPQLEELLSGGGKVDVLIEMRDRVDTGVAASQAVQSLDKNATKYEQRMTARYAVVETLQSTAEQTQQGLLAELEDLKNAGQVTEYESFYIVNMVSATVSKEALDQLASRDEIGSITLNAWIEMDWPEIDPSMAATASDDSVEWGIDQIGAPDVWNEFGIDGNGVVIGMIDTGIVWDHEALRDQWRGFDPADPSNPNPQGNWFDAVYGEAMPYDEPSFPHGSHVMGTVLGQDPAGENKIGVAPGAEWIAAKAFTPQGGQAAWLIAAGEYMLAPDGNPALAPDIVQNSWGGQPGRDDWYRSIVQAWRDAGQIPVFSAGNSGPGSGTVTPPSNYPESYAVAATDINKQVASFSSRGPSPYNDDLKPNVSAPGVNIRSAVPGGYEGGWNGTSMAAPHVAGTAALLLSVDPSLTVDEVEGLINDTATPLTDPQYREVPNDGYGVGLVNAYESVATIAQGMGGIEGTVLKEGTDDESPEISHVPAEFGYEGLSMELEADVSDNVSVVNVELQIRHTGEEAFESVEMNRTSGDFTSGTYEVDVPESYLTEGSFEYSIHAADFSGNETETSVYEVEVSYGLEPSDNFFTDFSSMPEGFRMNGDWEWGEPQRNPQPQEGDRYVATVIDDDYSYGSLSDFTLPPIDMRNADGGTFEFGHYFDTQFNYDFGRVLVSQDGGEEWETAEEFSGRDRTWHTAQLDLEPYAGTEEQLFVKFHFESDDNENYSKHAGWHIDHIAITESGAGVSALSAQTAGGTAEYGVKTYGGSETANETYEGLPLNAVVTVVETGRSARASLEDGSYRIVHGPTPEGEEYTLKVEAFGYYSQEASFTLEEEEMKEINFLLEEVPRGDIEGTVVNAITQDPVEGVHVEILNESRYDAVSTTESGEFHLPDVLIGDYEIRLAKGNYYSQVVEAEVESDTVTELHIELVPFPGSALAYDDGVAENARAYYENGFGAGVRMSPDDDILLNGISVYLFDERWPIPGGNEFGVAIYETDEDGQPGDLAVEYGPVTGDRGEWNFVSLEELNYETEEDFYVVIVQTAAYPNVPGIGVDMEGEQFNRSYQVNPSGEFTHLPESDGNYMIRSHVSEPEEDTPIPTPVLTGPEDGTYTNENQVTVSGYVDSDSDVVIYNNGEEAVTVSADEELTFEAAVELAEGENVLTASGMRDGDTSDPSAPVTVVKDTEAPELTLSSPLEGLVTNNPELTVSGVVTDDNPDQLQVNGTDVTADEDGSFETVVTLTEGENTITVTAVDLAGNVTDKARTVTLDTEAPELTNILPETMQYVQPGQAVHVSFESDEGGEAVLHVFDESGEHQQEKTMNESAPGVYEIDWSVPESAGYGTFTLQVTFENAAGNEASAEVPGQVTVVEDFVTRLAGDHRFFTAVEISQKGWDAADVVVLARGDDFADALAGVPLAYHYEAPVLLTRSDRLGDEIADEIARLTPEKVVILGGTNAVGEEVVADLLEVDSTLQIDRVAGTTRYETAKEIAERVAPDGHEAAVIVRGNDFADALSAAPNAAAEGMPILLTRADSLPEATEEALVNLGVEETLVIGGDTVITDQVKAALPDAQRLGGSTRFYTNIAVLEHFSFDTDHMYVATGTDFADALTGAALAARNNSGVILVGSALRDVTQGYITAEEVKLLTLFGGTNVIDEAIEQDLREAIQ
ncbi:hypothetical protein CR205_17895 [Alteribacter lacisalsi]|uniref:Peptidase S8/S53 domain-containing protein n=1 Tax=Alteribacter lacisalsi TaxID=2045244 RepID=A0A2W0HH45_9BACI|nr:cell wall-binding repeat-containing protein [Alteribacter lacisalsi]PYZ96232.1 hypothetical protein CR205_17895 [Alteribacter lacisalsi]